MNTQPVELTRKGRKVEQVLKGAHDVFMTHGYEGASMDDIARAAGVSKATIYAYFPDKRALFAAVAQTACQVQTRRSMSFADEDGPFAEKLYAGCRSFIEFMVSPFGVQMFRTVIAEAARFPEFGRTFWATGPAMAHAQLIEMFHQAETEGELKPIADKRLAAETLAELCKVHLHPRLMLGVVDRATPEEVDRVARNAVDVFLARYGA
jgi:AcrR family transcriptional regulator